MRAWAVVLLAVLLSTALGCGREGAPDAAQTDYNSLQYTVRGVIKDVSELGNEPQRVRIHHEAIDDLVGADGDLDPMRAMAMSLVIQSGTAIPVGLAPEDKVRFVLDVAWERTPVGVITSLERLDTAVELILE